MLKHIVFIMFLGRGMGWQAVIINSQSEYEFIQEREKELSDHHPFWIGGLTDADEGTLLRALCQYLTDSTGKKHFDTISLFITCA